MSKYVEGLNDQIVQRYKDSMEIIVIERFPMGDNLLLELFSCETVPYFENKLLSFLEPPRINKSDVVPAHLRPLFLEQSINEEKELRRQLLEQVQKGMARIRDFSVPEKFEINTNFRCIPKNPIDMEAMERRYKNE